MATPLAAGNHRQPTAGAMGLLVVGLAGLFSSLLIYSGTVISFLRFPLFDLAFGPAGYMALFAETTLLASTVLGAAIAMASLRKRRPLPFMVLGALAAVAYLCCSLGFGFACYFQVTIPEVYLLLGTAAAVADCGMVLVWGRVCARRLTMRPALVVVGLASVLSAAFCFLYSWLPLEGMLALFFVDSTLAAVIPLAVHDSRGGVEGDEGSAASASVAGRVAAVPADVVAEADEAGEADAPDARSRIASLFEVVGTPSLGLVSFAFVMAVMRTSFNESQSLYLAALALSGTGIVAYALLKRGRFLLPGGLQQTFLPVVALVVLAAANITATVGQGVAVSDWLTYGLYSLAAVLTLATLCAVAHAGEFSPDLVFAVAICAFCGASFIGQQVGGALPNDMVRLWPLSLRRSMPSHWCWYRTFGESPRRLWLRKEGKVTAAGVRFRLPLRGRCPGLWRLGLRWLRSTRKVHRGLVPRVPRETPPLPIPWPLAALVLPRPTASRLASGRFSSTSPRGITAPISPAFSSSLPTRLVLTFTTSTASWTCRPEKRSCALPAARGARAASRLRTRRGCIAAKAFRWGTDADSRPIS